jgi:hypothetical protein
MTVQTLHYKAEVAQHRADAEPVLGGDAGNAVASLDRFLNARLLTACSDDEARRWWERKVAAKRLLERVIPASVAVAATNLLEEVRRAAA